MKHPCAHCGELKNLRARGLCSLCYRDHRELYPKVKIHRPFTAREREIIRRDWGKRSCEEIAAELRRKPRDVYAAAARFGASQPRHFFKTDAALQAYLTRLHATGMSDREIGRVVGRSHATVARCLRRLDLPSNCRTKPTDPFPERTRQKLRRAKLAQIKSEGLESAVAFLRKHAEGRAQAVRMGWPQAQTLLEAKILEHLRQHGPSTADAICDGIGRRSHWTRLTIRTLRNRGLLVNARRAGHHVVYGLASGVKQSWAYHDPRMNREAEPA